MTAEFYNCAVEVMRGAEAIDRYVALPQQEAFDIEYWLLEEAKLQRMPPEKELARQVVIVIGAGSRHRQGDRAPPREGGRARGLRRPQRRPPRRPPPRKSPTNTASGIGVAGTRHLQLRPGHRVGRRHHQPRQHPRDARPGRARLRRIRRHRRHRGSLCPAATRPATFPMTSGRRPSPSTSRGSYLVADEAVKTWKEQGLPRQPGSHHQRQRRRREEGLRGL